MYNNSDKTKLLKLQKAIKEKFNEYYELKQYENLNWHVQNKFLNIEMSDDFAYVIYTNGLKIEFKNINSILDFIICNVPDENEVEKGFKYHNIYYHIK